jgi:two-component system NtrC family sensor kinase
MREIEPDRGRWKRLTRSLSAKLISLLLLVMTGIFGLLGYLNIHLHRQHLEATTLNSAERVSDVIKRSTSYYMLRNDREGMYHAIATMADEPGMVRVRIFDQEGRISYSSDTGEIGHIVDKGAEACYGCHTQSQPLARLNRPDRFRIYRDGKGQRILGVITPIENQPSCANADCHAHPVEQQVLGVLDTNLSLAKADAQLAQTSRRMLVYTLIALIDISLLSWLFVWPLKERHQAIGGRKPGLPAGGRFRRRSGRTGDVIQPDEPATALCERRDRRLDADAGRPRRSKDA